MVAYPKLTTSDVYRVTTHDNARVGGILKYTQNFTAVSAWVQAASVASGKVLDEYYNVVLKYKDGADFGSIKMLDIVHDNICNPKYIVDTAILFTTNNSLLEEQNPTNHRRVTSDKTNQYSSKYQSVTQKLQSALQAYQTTFDGLK